MLWFAVRALLCMLCMHVCVCVRACVCMYVCICICMCVYVCICVCACVCMCVYVYVCVYMCVYVYVCVYMCVYVYVCVYMCVYVYVCVYMCVRACVHVVYMPAYADGYYWSKGYSIASNSQNEPLVPSFLQPVVDKLISCGKAIDLLQECCPDVSIMAVSLSLSLLFFSSLHFLHVMW